MEAYLSAGGAVVALVIIFWFVTTVLWLMDAGNELRRRLSPMAKKGRRNNTK